MEILNCVLAEWKAGQSRLSKYRIGATIMMSLVYQINKKKTHSKTIKWCHINHISIFIIKIVKNKNKGKILLAITLTLFTKSFKSSLSFLHLNCSFSVLVPKNMTKPKMWGGNSLLDTQKHSIVNIKEGLENSESCQQEKSMHLLKAHPMSAIGLLLLFQSKQFMLHCSP